jgi:hypothetical protein
MASEHKGQPAADAMLRAETSATWERWRDRKEMARTEICLIPAPGLQIRGDVKASCDRSLWRCEACCAMCWRAYIGWNLVHA